MDPAAANGHEAIRPRRRASVRSLFLAAILGLALIAIASAVALAILAGRTSAAARRVGHELESVRAMSSAQLNLLVFGRENLLFAETGDPAHAAARDAALDRIAASLDTAMRSATDAGDQARVREVDLLVGRYIAQREELLRPDLSAGRQVSLAAPSLDAALKAADAYVIDSERTAVITEDRVWRLGAAATDVALGLVLVLPFAVFWLVRWVRIRVYLPFLELHRAIARYSDGEKTVRASDTGPLEIASMGHAFNTLADSLERQEQTRFEFLLAVAHDLRNPLTALKTTVALTEARLKKGELTREQLDQQQKRLATQVDRLNRMVGDLMDMTRVEAGRFDLAMGVCDVRTLASEAKDLFEGTSDKHQIRLLLCDEAVPVACDRQRLGQVLDNLVSNAIKYSPEGGEVRVRVSLHESEARIEVEDHGLGIARKNFERIFEPFQRLRPDQAPGVGLGLSVAKRLVEAQGGRIEVESEVGVGSTFRVSLPVAGDAAHAQQ